MTETTITTARLLLRPGRATDLDDLFAIFSDPRAMRYWDHPAYDDKSVTQEFLDKFMFGDRDTREEYILEYYGRCIGKAGIWAKPEIGYILHPDFWGKGLAREALAAIIPRAFAKWPDMMELTAELDPRNTASIRLLEHFGFYRTRLELENFQYSEDEWTDTAYYVLPRPPLPIKS